jgi:hypothetical protein
MQPQPQRPHPDLNSPRNRGQVLVIFAVSLVALLFFVGLAVDTGLMYLSYGQLKRAVDTAAVNAANNFKRGKTLDQMAAAALEELRLHNVDTTNLHLNVQVCDADQDGSIDATLQTTAPSFYALCPNINLLTPLAPGQSRPSPRKLIYVQATQHAPFYFLALLGISGVDLTTSSVGEAAAIDLVIVMDTSESMAVECQTFDPATGTCLQFKSSGFTLDKINDYDPNAPGMCNTDNSCQPLRAAKNAAVGLVNTLYPGYDAVGIVNLNTVAVSQVIKNGEPPLLVLVDDPAHPANNTKTAIVNAIQNLPLHDDAPSKKIWGNWRYTPGRYNPIFPDDRDGDGQDADNDLAMGYTKVCPAVTPPDRWVSNSATDFPVDFQNPFGWTDHPGVPCDDPNLLDAFHWADTNTPAQDDAAAQAWLADPHHDPDRTKSFSVVSTCTGCGIREGSNMLKQYGRAGAVWVMVLLSDGGANMSDTPTTGGIDPVTHDNVIPAAYGYMGFCQGGIKAGFWMTKCSDTVLSPRYCIYTDTSHCPPGTVPAPNHMSYSAVDYARDMADRAALYNTHADGEIPGNKIAIYSIGLNVSADGEEMLRYVAFIGAANDRTVANPCASAPSGTSCGNYYYAPNGSALAAVFDSIATKIYTRISN